VIPYYSLLFLDIPSYPSLFIAVAHDMRNWNEQSPENTTPGNLRKGTEPPEGPKRQKNKNGKEKKRRRSAVHNFGEISAPFEGRPFHGQVALRTLIAT